MNQPTLYIPPINVCNRRIVSRDSVKYVIVRINYAASLEATTVNVVPLSDVDGKQSAIAMKELLEYYEITDKMLPIMRCSF